MTEVRRRARRRRSLLDGQQPFFFYFVRADIRDGVSVDLYRQGKALEWMFDTMLRYGLC